VFDAPKTGRPVPISLGQNQSAVARLLLKALQNVTQKEQQNWALDKDQYNMCYTDLN